jgi:ribonuclease P protein component
LAAAGYAEELKMGQSFPKREKLKSKKLITQLFEEGKSVSSYPIKLIYLETKLQFEVPIQAGVTVPKKNFKSAVKRNQIKRFLRESYRLNKALVFNNSTGSFAFLFLYLGKEMPTFKIIDEQIKVVLHKFKKKIDDDYHT